MKTLSLIIASAFILFAFISCKDDVETTPESKPGIEYDEAYYASHATVSSSDSQFTSTGEGGTISFKSAGGSVVVNVDCGTEWTAQNNASDMFGCSMQATSITVTAEQNLLEEELTGSIILMTVPSGIQFATLTLTQNAYGAPEITVSANMWNVPAVGEVMTTEIEVDATDDWTISNEASWLTAEKGGTGLILTAAENAETTARTAAVVLTCSDEFNSDTATITVTQDGLAYITLSEKELEFGAAGGEAAVTVESNFEWSYAYESDWYTIVENTDGSLTVTCAANETLNDRTGSVAFAAGDGAVNVTEATLTITQGVAEAYITLGTTQLSFDSNENESTVTVESNFDWVYATEASWITLTKASDGTALTVKVAENDSGASREGTVTVTAGTGTNTAEAALTITQSEAEAFVTLNTTQLSFDGNENEATVTVESNYGWECATEETWITLTKASDGTVLTVKVAKNDGGANREGTVTVTAGTGTNVAEAQIMVSQEVAELDPTLMIFTYTITADGTTTNLPLYGTINCTVDWGDGNVETITSTQPEHTYTTAGEYDVTISGTVTALYSKNISTSSEPLPITAVKQWGITGLNDMQYAFYYCNKLASIPDDTVGSFSEVTSFQYAFYQATSLAEIPAKLFFYCTNVTTFANSFYKCSLTIIPSGLFDNCTSSTNFGYTFYNIVGITEIPENLFASCSKVTTFTYTFYKCTGLKTIPQGLFANNRKATTFSSTFSGCTALTGESPYDLIDGEKVHLYERSNHTDIYSKPLMFSDCFAKCTGLSDYNDIPSTWGGGGD